MRTWATRLLGLVLAVPAALPAPALVPIAALAAEGERVGPGEPLPVQGEGSGLEARVAALTRVLGLDETQKAALRRLLQEQRRQVQATWSDGKVSAAERIAATRKSSLQTADRIRALLNDEQRRRYDPPPQDGAGRTTSSVQVEEWMSGERKR